MRTDCHKQSIKPAAFKKHTKAGVENIHLCLCVYPPPMESRFCIKSVAYRSHRIPFSSGVCGYCTQTAPEGNPSFIKERQ